MGLDIPCELLPETSCMDCQEITVEKIQEVLQSKY